MEGSLFTVPFRWFTRVDPGTRHRGFYCKAWAMEVGNHDGEDGWLVHEECEFEVCESDLLLNFPTFAQSCEVFSP
ncbi:hypothetical protein CPC08DRAFT_435344 [Agrocybe pediades]|nr:hypothetical protein CPC08DRAFT_435344 [Agrocybe pediades]